MSEPESVSLIRGQVLSSADPEPAACTAVMHIDGRIFVRHSEQGAEWWGSYPVGSGYPLWEDEEPECRSWIELAGNHGPVRVVDLAEAIVKRTDPEPPAGDALVDMAGARWVRAGDAASCWTTEARRRHASERGPLTWHELLASDGAPLVRDQRAPRWPDAGV